jgi:hypothetical protein
MQLSLPLKVAHLAPMDPYHVANRVNLGTVFDPARMEHTIGELVSVRSFRAFAVVGVIHYLEGADVSLLLFLVVGQGGVDNDAV